ncbi:MAG: methyl-accepting chemotaxis protein, partial [Spirochaetaceae bacterium]
MLVLFFVLAVLVRQTAREAVIPMATELALELVDARADELNQVLAGHLLNVRSMSQRNLIRSGDLSAIATDLAARANEVPPQYEIMFFAAPNGSYVATSGAVGNVGDREYFIEIMRNGAESVVGNAVVSRSTGNPIIALAHEVRNAQGERIGLVAATVRLETLSEIVNVARLGARGFGYLVDASGLVVAHPDEANRMTLSLEQADAGGYTGLSALWERMRTEPAGIGTYTAPDGVERTAFFAELPAAQGWAFVVEVPTAQLADAAGRVVTALTVLVVAIFLVVVVISLIVARVIARPIRETSAMLTDIADGEGDLTQTLPVRSRDELGTMASAFNRFIVQLANIVVTIRGAVTRLEEIGQTLASNMEETSAAVNEIAANIDGVKHQVINQSASVTEVSSTMEQIARNIESLNGKIESQAASVIQSSSSIEEMVANIQSVTGTLQKSAGYFKQLMEAAETGKNTISSATSLVRDIAEKSDGLLDANAAIQAIASQTNLLAMNAAIEAAHAGTYGRGFAVVADEIRKLAEGAAEQSKSISSVLKSIKTSIDSVSEASVDAEQAFEHVSALISTLNELEQQIHHAMEEQSAGSIQVLKALEEINQVTQEVQSGSGEMTEGSKIIIEEMQRLVDITHEVESSMNEMATGTAEINRVVVNVV